jgi:hypothetical protein
VSTVRIPGFHDLSRCDRISLLDEHLLLHILMMYKVILMRNWVIVSDVAHDWLLNPLSLLTRVPLRCLPLVHLSLVPNRLALRVTKSLRSLLLLSVSILVLLLHSAHSTVLILQPLRVEIYLMWLLLVHHKFTEPSHSTIT